MTRGTKQEHVDSLTMQIHNPNVRGSGYIEHPPQVPFGEGLSCSLRLFRMGTFPNGFRTAFLVINNRKGRFSVSQGNIRDMSLSKHTGRSSSSKQQPHRAPAPTTAAFTHPKQHVAAPAGAPVAARTTEPQTSAPAEEKKLSKSAKAKLRKKMREGKI
eukprot:jgi/Picre1/34906/NNA_002372.t1